MDCWGLTDIGMARMENQDNFILKYIPELERCYCSVCDGMGGANAGATASSVAIDIIDDTLSTGLRDRMSDDNISRLLMSTAAEANSRIFSKASSDDGYFGMGTTMVTAVLYGNRVIIGNVGDSRAYVLSPKGIRQITKDHSIVQEMYDAGKLSEDEVRSYPAKNIITRAIGTDREVKCDVFCLTLEKGDKLLLCSDGLTNMLEDERVYEIIKTSDSSETSCRRLVKAANDEGGRDNITAVIVGI